MVVVDASVWIAWFKQEDAFREEARRIILSLSLSQEKITIPAIAFSEVAGAIKRITKSNDDAWEALFSMKGMKLEVVADSEKLEPTASKIAINHNIRGADACYLAVAEMTRSKLITFDQQQQKAFDELSKAW